MQAKVTRLVNRWEQPLADSIAAMNLFRDESAARRAAAIERIVATAGGDCQSDGAIWAENALRGVWKLRCARGAVQVGITLAPTEPARVQQFTVTGIPVDRQVGPQPSADRKACAAGTGSVARKHIRPRRYPGRDPRPREGAGHR